MGVETDLAGSGQLASGSVQHSAKHAQVSVVCACLALALAFRLRARRLAHSSRCSSGPTATREMGPRGQLTLTCHPRERIAYCATTLFDRVEAGLKPVALTADTSNR